MYFSAMIFVLLYFLFNSWICFYLKNIFSRCSYLLFFKALSNVAYSFYYNVLFLDSMFNLVNNSLNSSCLNILFRASVSRALNKECILVNSNSSFKFFIAIHLLLIYLFLLQKASSFSNLSVTALEWHACRFSPSNCLYFSSKNFSSSYNSSIWNNILC